MRNRRVYLVLLGLMMYCGATLFAQRYNLRTYGAEADIDPYVTALAADSSGYLWLATRTGTFRFDGFRFDPQPDSLAPELTTRLDTGIQDSLARWAFPRPAATVTATLRTRNDRVWVGTQRAGAYVYLPRTGRWLTVDERSGLGRNHVTSLLEDRWGYVWIGTFGGGLSRYAGRQFVRYGTADGLRQRAVHDIVRDSADGYWLAAGRAGISHFSQDNFRHYGPAEGYPLRDARTLLADGPQLWIGTRGTGLFLFDSLGFHEITPADSLAFLTIQAIAKDRLGTLWLGTAGQGLLQLSPPDTSYRIAAHKRYGSAEGLPTADVRALHVDRRARVWVGTAAGAVVLAGGELQDQVALRGLRVNAFSEDSNGRLWAATNDGLWWRALYEEATPWQRTDDKLLPQRQLHSVCTDSLGFLWTAGSTGLYRLRAGDTGGIARAQRYGRAEGFPTAEVLPGALLPEAGGTLWLGTTDGLVYYRPGTDQRNTVAPVIDLRDIRLFYESLENTVYRRWLTPAGTLRPGLELPPTENHLGFEFFAVNLPDPDGLRYQWRLEGAEATWSPLTTRRDAMYPNLPPGEYTFRVRACNEEGRCGEEVRAPFSIRAPWWQHWWVAVSGFILLLLLGWGLFSIRLRQIKRREARERARLELENQLLALEGKARRLQMNPHFIFNALHTVQGLIAQGETGKARRQLTQFSKLMRAILEQSIHDKISLADEIATLESYLAVERTSRSEGFTSAITTELEDPAETLAIPPMLVQPFVENALQHGLAQVPDGRVVVHFAQVGEVLTITITDNGIGRAAAAKRGYKTTKGRALEVTRERLRLLGGRADLGIEDLADTHGQPTGTRVILVVPV